MWWGGLWEGEGVWRVWAGGGSGGTGPNLLSLMSACGSSPGTAPPTGARCDRAHGCPVVGAMGMSAAIQKWVEDGGAAYPRACPLLPNIPYTPIMLRTQSRAGLAWVVPHCGAHLWQGVGVLWQGGPEGDTWPAPRVPSALALSASQVGFGFLASHFLPPAAAPGCGDNCHCTNRSAAGPGPGLCRVPGGFCAGSGWWPAPHLGQMGGQVLRPNQERSLEMGLALQQARRGFLLGCRLPFSACQPQPLDLSSVGGPISRGETAPEREST